MRCALRSGVRTLQGIGGVQVLECGARRDRRRSREAFRRGDLRADVEYDCAARPEQIGGRLDRSVSVVGAVVADENGRLFHGGSYITRGATAMSPQRRPSATRTSPGRHATRTTVV